MDPNACLRLIAESPTLNEASEHIANLREWISRGGFRPDWSAHPEGETRYQRGVGADVVLFLDHRGAYIPRDFARCVRRDRVEGVTTEQWSDLENPDSEAYWETWSEVCDSAICTDDLGVRYHLNQDGELLFLIPTAMMWDDGNDGYVWPECAE